MKRPMIFIHGLSQSEIEKLKNLSEYSNSRYFLKISENTQVYTHSDGSLEIVNNPAVDVKEEILCNTYDEFMTHYSQHKLLKLIGD